jgi:hypothetical protein
MFTMPVMLCYSYDEFINNRFQSLGHLEWGRGFGSVVIPEAALSAFFSLRGGELFAFEFEKGA